jgi:hypothetical protein
MIAPFGKMFSICLCKSLMAGVDADASASRALHLGPTEPLYHGKPYPR